MAYEYRCEICHELVHGSDDEVLACPAHPRAGVMSCPVRVVGQVTIDTVTMPIEAARSVEWAGVSVAEDLRALRAGETTYEQLLAECLDGAEPEHEDDWRDYVSAVCRQAEAEQGATYAQIAQLREEALTHGDLVQARICDLAIYGEIEPSALRDLPRAAQSRLNAMTQGKAQLECDRVIRSAAAEVAS